jgi:hypothetical protein
MANHKVPLKAERIERYHGIDADGNVVTLSVYKHVREGHTRPMFFLVQYREVNRKIDRGSRWTREYSGPEAEATMRRDLAPAVEMLAESREAAAVRFAPGSPGTRLLRELRVSRGIDA